MGFNFNISFGKTPDIERYSNGSIFYRLLNGTKKGKFNSVEQKVKIVLDNPATLKVLSFMADTFSQVKIDEYSQEKLKTENVLYSIAQRPNDWQTWTMFLWEFRFWLAIGNVYLYEKNNIFYCLKPYGIKLTTEQKKAFKRITLSRYGENTIKNIKKGNFKYVNENGEESELELSNLHIFSDLSNGVTGDWFEGSSRLDALYKIISNSETALDSEGSNLEFAGKFLVSGEYDINNYSSEPMDDEEKLSTEKALASKKKIHVVKDKVNVNQFVSNLSSLKLPESYLNALFLIGNMYNIPKDVLEVLAKGATYENQEKSMGRYVDYTESPKVLLLTDWLESRYQIDEVKGTFSHLPFNAVFEAEKASNNKLKMETLKMANEMGVDVTKQIKDLVNKMS